MQFVTAGAGGIPRPSTIGPDGETGDHLMTSPEVKAMAAVGGAASIGAVFAPRQFLGLLGIPRDDLTPAAVLGWRLFAARTAAVSLLAARGNATAREMFLPVQALDQLAWWEMYRRGELSLRAASTATALSAAIIGLDLRRRLS